MVIIYYIRTKVILICILDYAVLNYIQRLILLLLRTVGPSLGLEKVIWVLLTFSRMLFP